MKSAAPTTVAVWLACCASPAIAQIQIQVTSATDAAIRSAFQQANLQAFRTSPTNPVVITLANSLIGQTITLNQTLPLLAVDHVRIQVAGAGQQDRVILDAPTLTGNLLLTSRDAVIENLTFARTGAQTNPAIGDAVIASGAADLLFEDCTFYDSAGIGLWFYGVSNATVRRCRFESNGDRDPGPGMRLIDGCDDILIDGCEFLDNYDAGLVLAGTHTVTVVNSTFRLNRYGILATPVTTNLTFGPGNLVVASQSIGMLLNGGVDVVVQGNTFQDNGSHGLSVGDRTVRATIRDNTFTGNAAVTTSATQAVVAASDDVQLLGNVLQNGIGDGLVLTDCNRVTIGPSTARAGSISGTRRNGLLATRVTDLTVQGLLLSGNQAAATSGSQLQCTDCVRTLLRGVTVTTTATAALSGISINGGGPATIGGGTLVTGHRNFGITTRDADDVVLGERTATTGVAGLTVRGNGTGIQMVNCSGGIVGDAANANARVLLDANGPTASVTLSGCHDVRVGPAVTIDSGHVATIGLQTLGGCQRIAVSRITVQNHVQNGISFNTSSDCSLSHATVDGNASAPRATGTGVQVVLADRAVLLDNLVRGHAGDGMRIDSSRDVLLLPGNRCLFQDGDGIVAMNASALTPAPVVTIQSAVAVGNNFGSQSGIRCSNVDARLVNCTATRNNTGLNLQGTGTTTAVNCIFFGNVTRDRNKASTATAIMRTCLHRGGTFTAGAGWADTGNLVGPDPLLQSPATGDVGLQSGSPALDVGLHATPPGITVPCTDANLQPRVRGPRVDLGARERTASTPLDLAGPWLRAPSASVLVLTLQAGTSHANRFFTLWGSGSGTGPGVALPGTVLPLNVDSITGLLLAAPVLSLGRLDGIGTGSLTLPIPPDAVPLLPKELTFMAITDSAQPLLSNPVVVRFER